MTSAVHHADAPIGRWVRTGLFGGVAAGVVFAVFEMVVAEAQGDGFFMPLRMIGAILLGEGALESSYALAEAAGVGLVLHLVLSAIYGVTFAAALALVPARRVNRAVLVAAATLFGLALWLVNFFVIAPVLFEWFGMADDTVQFLAHTFFFGTTLGLMLAARQPEGRRARSPAGHAHTAH